jgi:hypothetical protein
MNLLSTISIYAGGPGSGCQGENCGRPKSKLQENLEIARKQWGPNNLWSKLGEHGHPGNTDPFTKEELTKLKAIQSRAGLGKGGCKVGFCFMNSQKIALSGLHDKDVELVEGLVSVHGVPITHSWIEYKGKVYDPTLATYKPGQKGDYTKGGKREAWSDQYEPEYVGIAVPKDEIYKHKFKTGTYDPLSHEWDDPKLMQRIWGK